MTTISLELPEEKVKRVREAAAQLGLPLETFVEKSLDAALSRKDAMKTTFDYVLKKNAELYRRLAQ
jgi:hypothetical protein